MDYTISSYKGIAVFQLVINGVGGNLVAVQASRISTSLYKDYHTGVQGTLNVCISPFHAFFAKGEFVIYKININCIGMNLTKNFRYRRTRKDS